eukprot:360063-Rhodomonas_salina.2
MMGPTSGLVILPRPSLRLESVSLKPLTMSNAGWLCSSWPQCTWQPVDGGSTGWGHPAAIVVVVRSEAGFTPGPFHLVVVALSLELFDGGWARPPSPPACSAGPALLSPPSCRM